MAGALGALLLVLATFTTVIQITVGTVSTVAGQETAFSGFDRHGPALVLLGVVSAVLLLGAVRGARPAMLAVVVLGAAALVIAITSDLPDTDETGRIGDLYSDASAGAGIGFYFETLGGVLLIAAGGALLLLAAGRGPGGRGGAGERASAPPDDVAHETHP